MLADRLPTQTAQPVEPINHRRGPKVTKFDAPLFKRLAPNDTGATRGHQAGFLVPKDLGIYFPALPAGTALQPTPSTGIRGILVVDGLVSDVVDTVYQYQTWGGTRTPERRVTANLGPLLSSARGDDILLIERATNDDRLYRFTLVRQNSSEFAEIDALAPGRWGRLQNHPAPATAQEIQTSESLLDALANAPFVPFESTLQLQAVNRVVRGRAFSRLVKRAYNQRCAMCGGGLVNSADVSEVEAAHIITRGALGSDDVRNGISLCRSHHWAFDNGIVSVDAGRCVIVKPTLLRNPANIALNGLHGKPLLAPSEERFAPDLTALAWHREHIYGQD
ncbi:HNH endonuclease [Brevundimonas sp. R86498]|uniref:HNH endonuclease n=1 Tax=Brevundimonas sp. R86498 TaxID=3093845 RepID=UPI0037C60C94